MNWKIGMHQGVKSQNEESMVKEINRRQFLAKSSTVLGVAVMTPSANSLMEALAAPVVAARETATAPAGPDSGGRSAPRYNANLRTAIGLGDELPGIVDKFGQLLRGRNAATRLELGAPLQPAENAEWSQSLLDGYLPVVETQLKASNATLRWAVFSSDYQDVKADYIEIKEADNPYRLTLLFPYTTSIEMERGSVVGNGKYLALFPPAKSITTSQAKYNLVTPETHSEKEETPLPAGVDPAFANNRWAHLHRSVEYRFPVTPGKTYYVFLGVLSLKRALGENTIKFSVNEQSQMMDFGLEGPGPVLREFKVTPRGNELRVQSANDPSSTGSFCVCKLNGIWIFDEPVEAQEVKKGALDRKAIYYVQCGKEPDKDVACCVTLDYEPQTSGESRWIRLPYDLNSSDASKASAISPDSARAAAKERWNTLLAKGAEFTTGVSHLDNIYKTSLINLFLMRTKYAGGSVDGQDIYVVKPGPDDYDTFWSRDGAYITTAFNLAGLPDEAEKSLRLFWQPNLRGMLAAWGQQVTGEWASPTLEWDAQGQSLWTLASHYEFTRDKEWLRTVYESIRRGAAWIKSVTEQTQFLKEDGERPIYYGLLPIGEGEGIEYGYNYYHCFWAVLGLRLAVLTAEALQEKNDLRWMKPLYEEFSSNLRASVKLACQRVANNKFIPATPFNPNLPIWGSMAALYPSRFLDPHDPVITGTLEILDGEREEDTYIFEKGNLWTYITVEGAMCHLLRDELPMFYTLYNGFVSHVSPTNAWMEGIYVKGRIGSGDMPHSWAAAQYVTIHRSSLVYENEGKLELCWGVQPEWLHDGAKFSVKRALTKFGRCEFNVQHLGTTLVLDYDLAPKAGSPAPEEVRFHIPKLKEAIKSIRVNGKTRMLSPEESVIKLS
jgi:hypothetical protein